MSSKRQFLLFVCKHGRIRDVPLLREGARAAGYKFFLLLVPFAYPMLLVAALARALGADIRVIFSDYSKGDSWYARLFGARSARMLWNYGDEFPVCFEIAPTKRVCFFDDSTESVQRFCFAPQPVPRISRLETRSEVVFIGDVSNSCTLPQGFEWWELHLHDLMLRKGYGFYLEDDYKKLLSQTLSSPRDYRQAKVLTKNLLRLWIVQAAQRDFGKRIVIIGSNWRNFGVQAAPSMYSMQARLNLYASAVANLDCGSKSGDSALYPRTSEIISYSEAPLQVICEDSAAVFGELENEIVFRDKDALCTLIEKRLQETPIQRRERSVLLARHLQQEHLTMADSLIDLFRAKN